jgi:hypothetical protein
VETRSTNPGARFDRTTLALVAGAAILGAACAAPEPPPDVAAVIAPHLGSNSLGVQPSDLAVMENPRGEGHLVYVPRTQFEEGRRFLIWLVIDGEAYTINGQTHNLTPEIPFPSAAGAERWARTGLDPNRATGTLELVFGDE